MLLLQLSLVVPTDVIYFRSRLLTFTNRVSLGWYYFGPRSDFGGEMPAHPTISAFGRASTLSLGSIAFGSLIVTILELIRMLLSALRHSADAENNGRISISAF